MRNKELLTFRVINITLLKMVNATLYILLLISFIHNNYKK